MTEIWIGSIFKGWKLLPYLIYPGKCEHFDRTDLWFMDISFLIVGHNLTCIQYNLIIKAKVMYSRETVLCICDFWQRYTNIDMYDIDNCSESKGGLAREPNSPNQTPAKTGIPTKSQQKILDMFACWNFTQMCVLTSLKGPWSHDGISMGIMAS